MHKWRTLTLVVSLIFVCSCAGQELSASKGVPELTVRQAPTGTRRALLVGINKYRHSNVIPQLSGAVNDVDDMKGLLIGKFNFQPENIMVLLDEKATHAGIISAIETHLINKTQPGDIVVFHYSGHGSQMKDATGESPSGLDETLVPHDSRDPENKVSDISGGELKPLLRRLSDKTKNVTFILDSCHSGSLVRGARTRTIPADTRPLPATKSLPENRGLSAGLSPRVQNRFLYALIAAASSRELAYEHIAEGKTRGALTYFFTRAVRNAGAGATYRDIMDSVMGDVTSSYPTQHPQLEGLQADQHIFGDNESVAQTYVLASPSKDGRVTLGAGQIFGITAGSIFDVYPPGTKAFEGVPVAKVQVSQVSSGDAVARLISGSAIQNSSRAVEREHSYDGMQLGVYFDPASESPEVRAVRNAVSELKHVQVVKDSNVAHLVVKVEKGQLLTLGADETTFSPPIDLSDRELGAKFKGYVDQWAIWFNVLSIRNANPALSVTLEIQASRNGKTRSLFQQIDLAGLSVEVGEGVAVTVSNKSNKDVYFALLDLETNGSITLIYPAAGTNEVLKPGSSFTKTFTSTLPDGRSEVIDVVKVIASVNPFDATILTRPPTRDIPADPLGKVLSFARGLRPDPPPATGPNTGTAAPGLATGPIAIDQWVTTQRVLKVRKQ